MEIAWIVKPLALISAEDSETNWYLFAFYLVRTFQKRDLEFPRLEPFYETYLNHIPSILSIPFILHTTSKLDGESRCVTRRSRQASPTSGIRGTTLGSLHLDSRYRRNRPILGSWKRYRGERGGRGNNLDGSPITPVSWPSASSGGPPKIHPSLHHPPSFLLLSRGGTFSGPRSSRKEIYISWYLDNFKNNLNETLFLFLFLSFFLESIEIPDIIISEKREETIKRRRIKGRRKEGSRGERREIGRVNRIVPITRAPFSLSFFLREEEEEEDEPIYGDIVTVGAHRPRQTNIYYNYAEIVVRRLAAAGPKIDHVPRRGHSVSRSLSLSGIKVTATPLRYGIRCAQPATI